LYVSKALSLENFKSQHWQDKVKSSGRKGEQ